MDTLTRAMHDAADDAPTTLDAGGEEWVSTSWRSGRRRRAVRGVAAGAGLAAAAALVVSLVVSGVGGMPSASVPADGSSRSAREGVTSHPQRIGHQWWVRDLPAAPGPIAGVVQVATQDADTFSSSWQAVTTAGTRFHLPAGLDESTFPAISPDGTRVGFVQNGFPGDYEVRDLTDGTVVRYPHVGHLSDDGSQPSYELAAQEPSFFSPSGEALALEAATPDLGWDGVIVLGDDGSVTEVPGMSRAAGWLDDDRVVGRGPLPQGEASDVNSVTGVDLVVWDRRTGRTAPLVRVQLPRPTAQTINTLYGQYWGALRSDRTLWLTYSVEVPTGSSAQNQRLAGYALPSGTPIGLDGHPLPAPAPVVVTRDETEVVSFMRFWHGTAPLAGTDGEVTAVFPAGGPGDPLVVVDPSADVTQVIWAQDAIGGSPRWSPLGTWSFLPLWWWKEIALAALAIAAARWWLVRRRRLGESKRSPRVHV
jgi:hypothetical protein